MEVRPLKPNHGEDTPESYTMHFLFLQVPQQQIAVACSCGQEIGMVMGTATETWMQWQLVAFK